MFHNINLDSIAHYSVKDNKIFYTSSILTYDNSYILFDNHNFNAYFSSSIWDKILYIIDDLYFLGFINSEEKYKSIIENSNMKNSNYHYLINALVEFNIYIGNNRYIGTGSKTYLFPTNTIFDKYCESKMSDLIKEKYLLFNSVQNNDGTNLEIESKVNMNKFTKNKEDKYISWDSYFMGVAKMISMRSKDPSCKVGACIVRDNKILSTGYNGFPRGLSDKDYPWTKGSEKETENKYFYVVHAELNAILNSNNNVSNSTLYVTKFPCNECCKAIIQSGIKSVIYDDSIEDVDLVKDEKVVAAMKMLYDAGISVDRYKSKNISINIEL